MPRDFDQTTITDAVLARFGDTADPRLKTVVQSLVRHLHDFARDVQLTLPEWEAGIGFLTRTGQTCDAKRQEFILLSDVLGLSMLVDAVNHPTPEGATATTILGPFYVEGAEPVAPGSDISGGASGEPLWVTGRVETPEGAALPGAWVDVWQADDDGYYDLQRPGAESNLRARLITDDKGEFRFWTIVPAAYPIPDDGPVGDLLTATGRHPYRPAHIHFMIGAERFETLVTHLFIEGDPYLDSDAVFGVKDSLIVSPQPRQSGVAPDGRAMPGDWRTLEHDFGLRPAPLSGAAQNGRS